MKKVLICDYANALEPNYEPTISSMSEAFGEPVECLIRPYVSDEELVQELAGVDGLITGFLEIGEEILAQVPDLACISVSGVGYSNIDVAAAKRHHVAVCHIREYCTEEVAEHTFALIGALNRHLKYYTKRVEEMLAWKYQALGGEAALQQALDSGKIRAAGLDVLEAEAPDLAACGLLGRENVILTPHSAFYSAESILKLQRISGANMGYFLAGAQEKIDAVVE